MRWLIDGHNLIGQMPTLQLDDPNDEEKLLEYLHRFRARTGHSISVFFDSGPVYRPAETKKLGGITVKFASPRKTADQLIVQRIHKVKNPQAVIVVSSDRAVQQAAQRAGVRVLAAGQFAPKLLQGSSTTTSMQDQGSQADVNLSPEEVDEWLTLFNQATNE